MTRCSGRFVACLLLVSYALTGIGGMSTHHHGADAVGGPDSIATHACGEREIHIPLENLAGCAVCLTGISRSAILPADQPEQCAEAAPLFLPAADTSFLRSVSLFSSGKRGPPLS